MKLLAVAVGILCVVFAGSLCIGYAITRHDESQGIKTEYLTDHSFDAVRQTIRDLRNNDGPDAALLADFARYLENYHFRNSTEGWSLAASKAYDRWLLTHDGQLIGGKNSGGHSSPSSSIAVMSSVIYKDPTPKP